ncbi:MTSS I-BAR domain containing 2a isoform X4 [Gadus macrocephalus]|uniref:MTSS I-BAR domain containing 2a isoform X4 n=1 Tax=Gadus macrocephalus TaxID=80720 RepID=UPI0028CB1F4B|nr:MTSS I-BAR domain containing 2a isoform X4 [Gadus macrocephalus]
MESVEKECGALGGLFQAIVNDMKSSYPVWEDFSAKATKLHSQLRTTILAAVAFLDAFQKVADMATSSRGATRDIGSALTRMCMRHRSIETKLRHLTNALMEGMVTPLQDRMEEWKKTANQLDKDHAKEYKRSRQEIKRKSSDTMKLQKKARKGRGNLRPQLDSAMQDVSDLYLLMEETERQAVRRALLEERGRYCSFISLLQPVVNGEIAMLGEITHLQAIVDDLTGLTEDPHKLPPASEQVIRDLKGSDFSWSYQTPPSSPSSAGSRKSSMCSLLQMPSAGTHRLSSVSSHDSGFISQDANTHSKPPSPMPSDITSQKSTSSASSEASETCQSVSECNSPTVDWAKSSSYEPSLAATLQRRRESLDRMREPESPSSPQGYSGYSGLHPDEPQRSRTGAGAVAVKHGGEPMSPAASSLAMVLTRGLSTEQQKCSRDSLHYSSGYSTQTNTPSCSEDTIPSQGSDYECYSLNGDADGAGQADFDKSSTIPRHSNIAQNYRRMIQTKRPASTAGLPAGKSPPGAAGRPAGSASACGATVTSGTATIRRTPSSKSRPLPTSGPIPIRPPIVPVKTPRVPDSPGYGAAAAHRPLAGGDLPYGDDPLAGGSPRRTGLPNTWGHSAAAGVRAPPQRLAQGPEAPEDPMLAANRHSLVEKIGELAASARALGEGHFPFPSSLLPAGGLAGPAWPPSQQDPTEPPQGFFPSAAMEEVDVLVSIRRGVRLRKVATDDRSAPRLLG